MANNKYDKTLQSLSALKEQGKDDLSLSTREFIKENKKLFLDLLDDGHKVNKIHDILTDSGINITLGTLRAYIGDIKGDKKRKYVRKS
jgi:hypothetical protein